MNTDIKVWKDGAFLAEKHLIAKGTPTVTLGEAWMETYHAPESIGLGGVEMRLKDGITEGRAFAVLILEEAERIDSDIYEVIFETDNMPQSNNVYPVRALTSVYAQEEAVRQLLTRQHMNNRQRTPRDLEHMALEMVRDCQQKRYAWEEARSRAVAQRAAHDAALASLLAINPSWMTGEQRQQLAQIFSTIEEK